MSVVFFLVSCIAKSVTQYGQSAAGAHLFFGSAWAAVEADGAAWLAASLKLGLAAAP